MGRRTSMIGQFMKQKYGRLTVRGWLEITGIFLGIAIVAAIFLVKREVVKYLPGHVFPISSPEFFGSAHSSADPLPVDGNRITLLHNGNGVFPVMLQAIREAKKTINFEAFILHSGTVGDQFINAFNAKAQEGVEVRILLDGVGSGTALENSDVQKMKDAGCKFFYYHPARSLRVDRINRRTHRRVLVIDGMIAFTGGVGFADDWQGDGKAEHEWRDIHAKIEGPLVAKLQGAFQQHWLGSTGEILGGSKHFPEVKSAGSLKAQLVASTEFSIAPLPLVQAVTIAAAQKTIYITNPYCTPTDEQTQLLCDAVKRGVDVRLLLPGQFNDQPLAKAAGRSAYGKLLEGGVKVFEYEPSMVHSKTMVADGLFAIIGTSNLDARSSAINDEIDVTVYDEGFGKEMEKVFLDDLTRAKPYTKEDFDKRSLWTRLVEWCTIPVYSQL